MPVALKCFKKTYLKRVLHKTHYKTYRRKKTPSIKILDLLSVGNLCRLVNIIPLYARTMLFQIFRMDILWRAGPKYDLEIIHVYIYIRVQY